MVCAGGGVFFFEFDQLAGESSGLMEEGKILDEVDESEFGETALGFAEELAGATESEVDLGDSEAVGGFGHGAEPAEGFGTLGRGD